MAKADIDNYGFDAYKLFLISDICSSKSLNIREHNYVFGALRHLFLLLQKQKYVRNVNAFELWEHKQRILNVILDFEFPIALKGLKQSKFYLKVYNRNFSSREVHRKDIPKAFLENDGSIKVLFASQVGESLGKAIKGKKFLVAETGIAYKLEGRRSKWARKVAKMLKETSFLSELLEKLGFWVLWVYKRLIREFLEFLAKFYPKTYYFILASIEARGLENLDFNKFFAIDRPPPKSV